jgi:HAD superfamily hydrolase (TIGR01509 family)
MDRALIFDCDGVLGDTEADGHLVAFNQMWQKLGVPWQWSKVQYAEKLKIGGGKERMASLFRDADFRERVPVPESEEDRKALVARWHKEKTAIYQHMVESGMIPPRPGVRRLAQEAFNAGWKLAVASTSAPAAVEAMTRRAMGELASQFLILSGDIVPAKKPAPDIYNLALERLALPPQNCVAIEDSRNGMLAGCAAHIPVLVTISPFTADEDFHEAGLVVDSLGEPEGPHSKVLANRIGVTVGDWVRLEHLTALLEAAAGISQVAAR